MAHTKPDEISEYLKQYCQARAIKGELDRKCQALEDRPRLSSPLASNLSTMREQIEVLRAGMVQAVQNVMDLIDLLPVWSMERTVVEMRSIDCKKWERIAAEVHMSRSRVIDYYNAAMQALADDERTQEFMEWRGGAGPPWG